MGAYDSHKESGVMYVTYGKNDEGKASWTNDFKGSVSHVGNTVCGILEGLWLWDDAGNPANDIAPHQKIIVTLKDGDEVFRVKAKLNTWFGRSVAAKILECSKGDIVTMRLAAGKKAKVFFVDIGKSTPLTDDPFSEDLSITWVDAKSDLKPDSPEPAITKYMKELVTRIEKHPAFSKKEEKEEE